MEKDFSKVYCGIAKEIITPLEKMPLMGFGNVFGIPFESVHDDLYTRVMVIRDQDGETVIFCSLDIVFHDDSLCDELREYVAEKHNVGKENLHMCYTHTHFAPSVKGYDFTYYRDSYEKLLFDRTCNAIDRAFLSMEKGSISYAAAEGDWNVSRRIIVDGKAVFGPNPDGERDNKLYLLKFENESGELRGLAVNFACHASNLGGICESMVSSEYPGRLMTLIENEFYGANAIFLQGFGADTKLKRCSKGNEFGRITYEECDEIAQEMLGKIKEKVLLKDEWENLPIKLASSIFELRLPLEIYSKEIYKEELEKAFYEMMKLNIQYVLDHYDELLEYVPVNCGVIQLSPKFYILSMAGEPGINIQTVLRERMPDITLLCLGYNNAIAYIPSDKMIREGGYEAEDSIFEYRLKGKIKEGVDEIFINGISEKIKEVRR